MVLSLKPEVTSQQNCSFSNSEHRYSFGSVKLLRYLSEWSICSSGGFWLIDWFLEEDLDLKILGLDRCRESEFFPYLFPLPIPLLQVFLEFLLSLCSLSLRPLSVTEEIKFHLNEEFALFCLSHLGSLECKVFCFTYTASQYWSTGSAFGGLLSQVTKF